MVRNKLIGVRLTFELSRTRRNDARARQKENVPTLLAGPGGMPLGLGFNEGLGFIVEKHDDVCGLEEDKQVISDIP